MLPLIKKPGLDQSVPVNYRPISNLHTVYKLIERLLLVQLKPHLLATGNFNPLQSAYRSGHSTESALQKILDSFYKAIDSKKLIVMISLDISAALDTINHGKLLSRLRFRDEFGVTDEIIYRRAASMCYARPTQLSDGSLHFWFAAGLSYWPTDFRHIRFADQ